MKPIIEVQNLSKKYTIGATQPRYLSLRDSLASTFKGVKNWTNFDKSTPQINEFWALQNIDFQVNAGESVGIIGRNGAGKSTLLKILSRITPPTSGHAILRGRLASLLEVGTGFHPELTGRENVYFNGSILGLKKTEIDKKFDEIVDFSGIERFIDTPLKNYSSGMQLRLAFAVAAHLEPEILIIDEVLAVGDAEFQKKCLGKMDEVSKSGRTVIFVSHDVSAINMLCSSAICLNGGRIEAIGAVNDVIKYYNSMRSADLESYKTGTGQYIFQNHIMKKNKNHGIISAQLLVEGEPSDVIFSGQNVQLFVEYRADRDMVEPELGILIKTQSDIALMGFNNKHIGQKISAQKGVVSLSIISIPHFPIYGKGNYAINLYFGDVGTDYEILLDALTFELRTHDVFGSGYPLNPKYNQFFYDKINISNAKI